VLFKLILLGEVVLSVFFSSAGLVVAGVVDLLQSEIASEPAPGTKGVMGLVVVVPVVAAPAPSPGVKEVALKEEEVSLNLLFNEVLAPAEVAVVPVAEPEDSVLVTLRGVVVVTAGFSVDGANVGLTSTGVVVVLGIKGVAPVVWDSKEGQYWLGIREKYTRGGVGCSTGGLVGGGGKEFSGGIRSRD